MGVHHKSLFQGRRWDFESSVGHGGSSTLAGSCLLLASRLSARNSTSTDIFQRLPVKPEVAGEQDLPLYLFPDIKLLVILVWKHMGNMDFFQWDQQQLSETGLNLEKGQASLPKKASLPKSKVEVFYTILKKWKNHKEFPVCSVHTPILYM